MARVLARSSHLRTSGRRSALTVSLVITVAVGASACASTTYDETLATSPVTAEVTTTTVPTGTPEELLPRLIDEAASLSGVMIAEGDDRAVADRIVALWEASRPAVAATRVDLVASFEASVALVQKAVDFSRAADADKASKNLDALVDAFLSI